MLIARYFHGRSRSAESIDFPEVHSTCSCKLPTTSSIETVICVYVRLYRF